MFLPLNTTSVIQPMDQGVPDYHHHTEKEIAEVVMGVETLVMKEVTAKGFTLFICHSTPT